MGSSGQSDRSLGAGISLPQWMKNKMDARFDFDESTFSPPSHDDTFLYLRYPKIQQNKDNNKSCQDDQGFRSINEVLSDKNITAAKQVTSSQPPPPDFQKIDFSKHPLPCQPFVPNATQKDAETKPPKPSYSGNVKKSQGIDDGFHGQPALCGKSIVHVASQMVSGKVTRGFALENAGVDTTSENMSHKGSKSLPASPLASPMSTPDNSPKSRRKIIQSNRYFTGAFVPDKEKYQGSWILASILGQQREIVTNKIEEEDETKEEIIVAPKSLIRKKSISTQNLTYIPKDETNVNNNPQISNKNVYTNVFQAKPSELREMNFWSPTSM